jgi:hypothetical protein
MMHVYYLMHSFILLYVSLFFGGASDYECSGVLRQLDDGLATWISLIKKQKTCSLLPNLDVSTFSRYACIDTLKTCLDTCVSRQS